MMRTRDIFAMAVHNLWHRRGRTALNLLGVVIGCIVLLMTFAGVAGVKEAIHILFDSAESARQIGIVPDLRAKGDPPADIIAVEGEMSDERRERIAMQLETQWRNANRREGNWEITPQQIKKFEEIPGVISVVPDVHVPCQVKVGDGDRIGNALTGIDTQSGLIAERLIVGTMPGNASEAMVDEWVAYQLGYRSDPELSEMIGKTVDVEYRTKGSKVASIYNLLADRWGELSKVELAQQTALLTTFGKILRDLDATSLTASEKEMIRGLLQSDELKPESATPAVVKRQYTIVGVLQNGDANTLAQLFRGHYQGGSGGIYLPNKVASKIHIEVSEQKSFYDAIVTVASTKQLQDVSQRLESEGTRPLSAVRIIESMDHHIDESAWVVIGIAAAILLTAAIGISNTLLISVMERTPEFGILKSVGATDRTLLLLMVFEGVILGLLGAIVAILLSLLISVTGHGLLEYYVESRLNSDLASSLFRFSPLPMLGVASISVLICVLASLWPAWRAARLDPIVAMRRT